MSYDVSEGVFLCFCKKLNSVVCLMFNFFVMFFMVVLLVLSIVWMFGSWLFVSRGLWLGFELLVWVFML